MPSADALSQYKDYVAKNPNDKEGARKSYFDTFGVDPEQPRSDFQRNAARNMADIGVAQTNANYAQDISNAQGKAAGDIAKGVVLGGVSLATGGLAAGPAMALMGAAGVGAETLSQTAKSITGSTDVPTSGKDLAKTLGLEGALSAGGEGAGRAIGAGLRYVGKEMWPAMVMKSAAKAQEGQIALKTVQQDTFSQLRDFARSVGNPKINLEGDLNQFYSTIGKRATGTSQAFNEAMKPINAKLAMSSAGVHSMQPLDALMEIKSDLSAATYRTAGLNTDEFVALKNLTDAVDKKISQNLNAAGGDAATKLYGNFKAFTEQIRKDSDLTDLAAGGIKKVLGKAIGALPGVDAGVDVVVRQKVAPAVLERLFSSEKTAAMVRQAQALQAVGKTSQAQAIFRTAINTSDVGTLLTDAFKTNDPLEALKTQGGP